MAKAVYCLCLLAAVGGKASEEFRPRGVPTEDLWRGVRSEPESSADGPSTTEGPEVDQSEKVFIIEVNGVPRCTGVPVMAGGEIIATAAHCVYGIANSALSVRLEGNAIKSSSVRRVAVHPYYMPPSAEYDIAVIKATSLQGAEHVKALALVKVPPASGAGLKAKSWSKEKALVAVNATLEDRKSCRAKIGNQVTISSRMLCAQIPTDSVAGGSPLTYDNGLLGIGAYYPKDKDDLPKVFTNIANSEIYSFLEEYMG